MRCGPVPFELADGTAVTLRPVAATDREHLKAGFLSMSRESRYLRFFTCLPGLSDAQLRYLTEVDQVNHVAWVAVGVEAAAGRVLGVGRFVRMPEQPSIGEFSLTVVDGMQHKGLGRALLAVLYVLASATGIEVLRATCLPENGTMVSWLGRLGAKSTGYCEGTIELDLKVPEHLCSAGTLPLSTGTNRPNTTSPFRFPKSWRRCADPGTPQS